MFEDLAFGWAPVGGICGASAAVVSWGVGRNPKP